MRLLVFGLFGLISSIGCGSVTCEDNFTCSGAATADGGAQSTQDGGANDARTDGNTPDVGHTDMAVEDNNDATEEEAPLDGGGEPDAGQDVSDGAPFPDSQPQESGSGPDAQDASDAATGDVSCRPSASPCLANEDCCCGVCDVASTQVCLSG